MAESILNTYEVISGLNTFCIGSRWYSCYLWSIGSTKFQIDEMDYHILGHDSAGTRELL